MADRIASAGPDAVWGNVLPQLCSADLLLANLECALTSRRERWRDGHVKAFYFGAPPAAIEALRLAGIDFVALANNHILDFGEEGMRETIATIERAGIAHAGAGDDLAQASRPARLKAGGVRVAIIACADHPAEWAATERSAGVNFISVESAEDLDSLRAAIGEAAVMRISLAPDRISERFVAGAAVEGRVRHSDLIHRCPAEATHDALPSGREDRVRGRKDRLAAFGALLVAALSAHAPFMRRGDGHLLCG